MQRETVYDPVFDAQQHYRLLIDSMARPGKINLLPRMQLTVPSALTEAAALTGFALLNADVSFYVADPEGDIATRYLLVNTSGRPTEPSDADFVFASGLTSPVLVETMKKGTLPYPDEGATLVANVEALAAEAQELSKIPKQEKPVNDLAITLSGPGINAEKTFFVRGLNTALLAALQQSNQEFPLGIDLILTDSEGHLACIPRSSQVRWEHI